jgi:hypothetical protein
MTGVAVIVGCRNMGIVGQLAVLGGVARITLIIRLNDRLATWRP